MNYTSSSIFRMVNLVAHATYMIDFMLFFVHQSSAFLRLKKKYERDVRAGSMVFPCLTLAVMYKMECLTYGEKNMRGDNWH